MTNMNQKIKSFVQYLQADERSNGTIEKYQRDVNAYVTWLNGRPVAKETLVKWKEYLLEKDYAPVTINSMLGAVNKFFTFLGKEECHIKYLRIQRQMFRSEDRELTQSEYNRLVNTAQTSNQTRLALLLETICATGIRVSEVQYITAEAAWGGKTEISLKGKIRTILLPSKLCRKLLKYCKKQNIQSGEIFLTKNGKRLSRKQIWAEMKSLCKKAGVPTTKVFPHNLRHLFACIFYKASRDVARLADVLGHSSIDTTRIYLISTGAEHARQLERLGIII